MKRDGGDRLGDGSILRPGDVNRAEAGPRHFGSAPSGPAPAGWAFGGNVDSGGIAPGRVREPAARFRRRDSGQPRLIERIDVAPGLIRLRVERPPDLDFSAGQYVKFGLPGNQRSYTVVSAPGEPFLEFFVELIPGGRLSEPLRAVRPGDRLAVGPRGKGSFVLDASASCHLFVATVTGVAPFVSILRDRLRERLDHGQRPRPGGQAKFVLLHGASHADEFGYADELAGLSAQHPERLTYLPTVSRPEARRNSGWAGARGRVDTHVRPALARHGLPLNDTAVYACGNSGMIRNVRQFASAAGLRFHAEAFD